MAINQPYFDTLQVFIDKSNPDLISFKGTIFSKECADHINSKGYSFMPLNTGQDSNLNLVSPVAFKNTSFEFLASSFSMYDDDTLKRGENVISWYQLKNKSSGHIFYLFSLELQKDLNTYQSELIGFDLLKKIDKISAGVPVILLGDFGNNNIIIKNLLTDNWKNTYPLSEVKTLNDGSDFLVNDFLKIKGSSSRRTNDSIVNNVVINFMVNTDRISRNTTGESLPE
ncbi:MULTISPECIES: hypothetical protein [unclassified Saccharicrinis]|uniref:hypothetical protein n=1 Tax=unclassified Saccharicrinis TaxID=2646859 RepID=UPI003D33150D